MFRRFKFYSNLIPFSKCKSCKVLATLSLRAVPILRHFSTSLQNNEFLPYKKMLIQRRDQAERSLIIEISNNKKIHQLEEFCSQFGVLVNSFTYTSSKKNMVILEFEDKKLIQDVMKEFVKYRLSHKQTIPTEPFFKINTNMFKKYGTNKKEENFLANQQIEFNHRDLNMCNNISQQIELFYKHRKLGELETRLRFLACRKIEWLLPQFMSHICALPFGSSVSTLGHCSSDLDVCLNFWDPHSDSDTNMSRIHFQTIFGGNTDKLMDVYNLDFISKLMAYSKGFTSVLRIFTARVPIIKCLENYTGLECDITFGNGDSYLMTDLLYSLSCFDKRVSLLGVIIKSWAKAKEINSKNKPGRGISNFSLTLLLLHYLMHTNPPVLPFFERIPKGGGNFILKFENNYQNTQSLQDLLLGFFEFNYQYPFKEEIISLQRTTNSSRHKFTAMHLENPINQDLNVTVNVTHGDLLYFSDCCRFGMSAMSKKSRRVDDEPWGLTCLLENSIGTSEKISVPNYFKYSTQKNKGKRVVNKSTSKLKQMKFRKF